MSNTSIPMNEQITAVFETYPQDMHAQLLTLRTLIYDVAQQLDIEPPEETLKWGEPAYLTKEKNMGSTIRVAWKEKKPNQYSIFFKCTANLVIAFKARFGDTFHYGGNRSLDFEVATDIPRYELKQCIALALSYHVHKHLEDDARWQALAHVL